MNRISYYIGLFTIWVKHILDAISLSFAKWNNPPLVSIVVPIYNEEKYIHACIKSVRMQNYDNFECIIVNDASTDDSVAIIEKFISKHKRFRLVQHEANKGLAASRNTGIKHAKGEFITFLDADDFLLQNSLASRVRALLSAPERAAGVFHGIRVMPEDITLKYFYYSLTRPFLGAEIKDFISCEAECPFNAHAPMLKTFLVKQLGGFDENLRKGAEDWDFWQKVMRNGYSFLPVSYFGAVYRQKRNSMIHKLARHHAYEAMRLISDAYSNLETVSNDNMGYFEFDQSVSRYREIILKGKRLIYFAVLVYLDGDPDGFRELLSELPHDAHYYLFDHINVEELVGAAISRYNCLKNSKDLFKKSYIEKTKYLSAEVIRHIRSMDNETGQPASR